jgi:hypothetical protein
VGEAARWIAAVTPLTIALMLILLTPLLAKRVGSKGGHYEISWKPVAFHIKVSFSPERPRDELGGRDTEQQTPPEPGPAQESLTERVSHTSKVGGGGP